MEDKILILQIAFAVVSDSPFYDSLLLDARVEEVRRVYDKLSALVGDGFVEIKTTGMQ
jgi:hypothetical protein